MSMRHVQTCGVSDRQQAVKLRTCISQTADVSAGGMQLGKGAAWLLTIASAMPPCRPAPNLP